MSLTYNKMKKILCSVLVLAFISCDGPNKSSAYKNNSDNEDESVSTFDEFEEEEYQDDNYGFEDGTYSATVDYYNPSTGYSATYSLNVEVQNNYVTTIYFPNDGYLDQDHIYPDQLDENGFVNIVGEDGKTYAIQVDY
jgi:hypothetical protein